MRPLVFIMVLLIFLLLLIPSLLPARTYPVFVRKAAALDREFTLELYGNFVYEEVTPIYSPIVGVVQDIRVSKGDLVKKGQVLFTVLRDEPGFTKQKKEIKAPFIGIVKSINTYQGGRITPQNSVMIIASFDPIYLYIDVAEKDLAKVIIGDSIDIQVSYLSESVPGKIARILEVNPDMRMGRIKVQASNPQARIIAGTEGRIVYTYHRGKVIVIPAEAVFVERGRYFVWIKQQDQANKQEVIIGELTDQGFECLSGIAEGEEIIYYGFLDLKPGDRVTVVETQNEF